MSHKIGITNVDAKEKRLEKHVNLGWRVFQTRIFEDGNQAVGNSQVCRNFGINFGN
jgi:hypothetical protein